MSKKPDLGAMAMPKAKAAAMVPFSDGDAAATAVASAEPAPSAKSLTIKLEGPLYAALRQFCHAKELERGRRVTHQEVVVDALRKHLGLDG